MTATLTAPMVRIMAALPPGDADPASGRGPEWGKAAPVGLLIWLLMGLALYFLIKSMNRNLRRVPASFEVDGDTSADAAGKPGGDGEPGPGGDGDGDEPADDLSRPDDLGPPDDPDPDLSPDPAARRGGAAPA